MTVMDSPAVSLVIPTLNEEENLRILLPALFALTPVPQVIVSDGGSHDNTIEVARELGAEVVRGARGRGPQLNLGAEHSRGEVIVFLHADSWLVPASYRGLLHILHRCPEVDGGAFRFSLARTAGFWPRVYEVNVRLRNLILNLPYGDQGFFLRRKMWSDETRFAAWPLMEDVEWWERLRGSLTLRILPWPLVTSARRFEQRGYFRGSLRNLRTLLRYKLGSSPVKLAKDYNR